MKSMSTFENLVAFWNKYNDIILASFFLIVGSAIICGMIYGIYETSCNSQPLDENIQYLGVIQKVESSPKNFWGSTNTIITTDMNVLILSLSTSTHIPLNVELYFTTGKLTSHRYIKWGDTNKWKKI